MGILVRVLALELLVKDHLAPLSGEEHVLEQGLRVQSQIQCELVAAS